MALTFPRTPVKGGRQLVTVLPWDAGEGTHSLSPAPCCCVFAFRPRDGRVL